MSQMVKKVRNKKEEEIVKENTKNLVGLKEKLLCLSITELDVRVRESGKDHFLKSMRVGSGEGEEWRNNK